jgi:hypothetical protein
MSNPTDIQALEIVAYSAWGFNVNLVPAGTRRAWMDETGFRFAYHCLPMTLANQSGWHVLAPHGAIAEWNGGKEPGDLVVKAVGSPQMTHSVSQVGTGIMTWTIPYIFRTPPGWNLLCRGPANYPKDGVAPLEGLVETDWSLASFSMNWKMTRPGRVVWEAGEPVALLVPQRRGDLEQFTARSAELASDPELLEGYKTWITSRQEFLNAQRRGDLDAIRAKYQKHYFKGETNAGVFFEGHQKSRDIARFRK